VRPRLIVPALLAVAVGGAAYAAWRADFDAAAIAASVRAAGPLGVIALIGFFVVQCVIAPIPSEPGMMAAGYVYGPGPALVIAWIGVVLGASACFWLGRAYGRPLAERVVRADRLDTAEAQLQRGGSWLAFAGVLAIRMFAFHTFDVLSYACGLVRMPFVVFLAATVLGALPKVWAFTYAGATLAARPAWLDAVILVGTFGAMAVAVVAVLLRRRRAA
jgi:uncharacterized membrane protein YdjX (TVP38/TMEM64 family)